jgi:pimeloyl-ACP methyl ester carboxylesterase
MTVSRTSRVGGRKSPVLPPDAMSAAFDLPDELHWAAHGGGGEPAVVLVHGWTCDSSTWDSQISALAREHRVVVLDLPGHGRSGFPRSGRFTFDLFAAAVDHVRDMAGIERMVLVGHSMGALVTGHYARRYPQRLAGMVGVEGALDPRALPRQSAAPPGCPLIGPEGMRLRREVVSSYFTDQSPRTERDRISSMMLGAAETTAEGARRAVQEWGASTLPPTDVPALGVFAMTDPPAPERLAPVLRRYRQLRLPGRGHFPMVDQPRLLSEVLSHFLKELREDWVPDA